MSESTFFMVSKALRDGARRFYHEQASLQTDVLSGLVVENLAFLTKSHRYLNVATHEIYFGEGKALLMSRMSLRAFLHGQLATVRLAFNLVCLLDAPVIHTHSVSSDR